MKTNVTKMDLLILALGLALGAGLGASIPFWADDFFKLLKKIIWIIVVGG